MRHRISFFFALACLGSVLPAVAVDCSTVAGNLVTGCGFESPSEVATWSLTAGDSAAFEAGTGENGGALLGDAENFSGTFVLGLHSACFPVAPGETLNLGFAVRLVSGTAPSCTAGYQQWSDAGCAVGNGGAIGTVPVFPTTGGYSAVVDSRTVSSGSVAMSLSLDCRGAADFVARYDNAFAVRPLTPVTEIPTLGSAGAWLLAGGLSIAAAAALRRVRS